MNKKNGFIATSLIYSFFLVFITLFLTIIADYLQNKVLLNTIESDIKQEINNSLGIQNFEIGQKIHIISFSYSISTLNSLIDKSLEITDIKYKNSGNIDDCLVLTDIDANTTHEICLAGKRLLKEPSNDGFINIKGEV